MDQETSQAFDEYVDRRVDAKIAPLLSRLAALESSEPAPPPLPQPPESAPPRVLRLGMNLVGPTYYEPVWAFSDLMATSQINGSRLGDLSWSGSAGVTVDMDGWPHGLAAGQSVLTATARWGGHYPAGEYLLSWEGQGAIVLGGDVVGTFETSPARVKVTTPSPAGIDVRITKSSPASPVRKVHLLMPGVGEDTFHPRFVESLRPYSVLRFMDWGRTNGSEQETWTDRPRTSWRSQARGVAYEHMLALANLLGADPWVCIPHKATPEYVGAMAQLFRSQLKPGLRVYLEYSNEAWNGAFPQGGWLEALSGTENVLQSYARLATAHFATWVTAWGPGGRERTVRVLSGQAANPDVGRQVLAAAGNGGCDVLAIAPYFGGSVGRDPNVATMTTDQVLDVVARDLPVWRDRMAKSREVAASFNVDLVAYEGGQHLAAVGTLQDNAAIVNRFAEANRHARMGDLYRQHLDHWKAIGGGLYCAFNDVYAPKKSGAWGALEWTDQDPTPKSKALVETATVWRGGGV